MKHLSTQRRWRWRLCLSIMALVACVGAARAEPRRLALVIGNSLYTNMPVLGSCAGSANVVAAALKRIGFAVTQLANATNGQMGSAIGAFGDAAAKASDTVAVTYLCGYAVAYDGRMFLLPASANLMRETDVLTQGIIGRALANAVLRANAAPGLVVMDSFTPPGTTTTLPLEAQVNADRLGGKGFAATQYKAMPPDGPTPLAAALVAGLAGPAIDARALLRDLRAAIPAGPQLALAVLEPAEPAWLVAPPPVIPPPPAPIVAPAPAPVAPAPVAQTPPPAPTAAPAGPAVLSTLEMRQAQLALQRLGYYAGKVDGMVGQDTLAAVRRYQHELHAEMTGRLTRDQADKLLAIGQ